MAKETQGHGYWGKCWLDALVAIDSRKKLARVMPLARSWKLKDIEIRDNMIKTHIVMPGRKQFYLHFFLPRFSDEDIAKLKTGIVTDKMIMARLLKHDLDPRILDICTRLGIQLFPTVWKEIKMYCSCPSWGMPCDHVAFALYMLSFEIDKNPFIIFSLHGLDLMELLKKEVGQDSADPMANILSASKLCFIRIDDDTGNKVLQDEGSQSLGVPAIDFTRLNDTGFLLMRFLPSNPPFYPHGDFHEMYGTQLKRMAAAAARLLDGKLGAAALDVVPPAQRNMEVRFAINSALTPLKVTGYPRLSADLLLSLLAIDDDDIADYTRSVQSTRLTVRLALNLLMHCSLVPLVARTSRCEFLIVWEPALVDEATREAFESYAAALPSDLLTLQSGKRTAMLSNQPLRLLSLVLGTLINLFSRNNNSDSIFRFFFNGERMTSSDSCNSDAGVLAFKALQIKSWLDHLTLSTHRFCPTVVVHDVSHGFNITLNFDIDGKEIPLREIMQHAEYDAVRYDVLGEVTLLSPFINGLERHVSGGASRPIHYSNDEFGDFITDILPVMGLLGIKTVVPDSLRHLLRPQLRLSVTRKDGDSLAGLSLTDLLDFHWQVMVGDQTIPIDELTKLVTKKKRFYSYNGLFFYVGEEDLRKIRQAVKHKVELSPYEKLQAMLGDGYKDAPLSMSDECRQLMNDFSETPTVPVPDALCGTLRPYQQRGFEWMYRNLRMGFGCIIADDMGLGKTIQVITLLLKLKEERKAENAQFNILIVVPATLVSNWEAELHRFAPSLGCLVYHGYDRDIDGYKGDILLTTYGLIRNDFEPLNNVVWDVMVIDEAQNIKNAETSQSRAVRMVGARCHIAISGTPIENRMSEFWTIMDFANKGYLGSAERFRTSYAQPIQQRGDKQCAERFRKITAPFLLRRLKSDKNIIGDLPDKIEENRMVTLCDYQSALYRQVVEEGLTTINAAGTDSPQALFRRRGLVLQMITALKQICDHPSLFLKNQDIRPELSGKAETLLSLVDSIVGNRQKVLVFTQFREMGTVLSTLLEQRLGFMPLFLHGGTSLADRKRMVDDFQTRPECPVFILSIKAGGTGLNLTAASHVIHYDLWWNPAVEQQATDRAYRIGQHQNVIVHRFVTQGTFEEQIDRLLQSKRDLADLTIATGESWIGNLSNDELDEIFVRG